jgi:hypothetical protein
MPKGTRYQPAGSSDLIANDRSPRDRILDPLAIASCIAYRAPQHQNSCWSFHNDVAHNAGPGYLVYVVT